MRRFLRAAMLFFALCFCGMLPAETGRALPAAFVTALQRALDADAVWTMEKTLPTLKRPLTSSGEVSCKAGSGAVWRTVRPFLHEIHVTKDFIKLTSAGETETRVCGELPHYAAIQKATDAFLSGDTRAFDVLFDWTWFMPPSGGTWMMRLDVRDSRMRRVLTHVTLSGAETLESVTLATPRNGTLKIRFKEKGRGAHSLWKP